MLLSLMQRERFRLGAAGVLAGAALPFLFLLHRISFLKDIHPAIVTATGAVVTLGLSGYIVGRLRDKDASYRSDIVSRGRELALMNSVTEIVSNTRDMDSLLYFTLKEVLTLPLLSAEGRAAAFVKDEAKTGQLRLAASISLRTGRSDDAPGFDHCLCGKAVRTGEAAFVRGAGGGPSTVVIPIKGFREVVGAMQFAVPGECEPSPEEMKLLLAVAGQLAPAAQNILLTGNAYASKEELEQNGRILARKINALNSLVEVDKIILSTLDRDEMLFKVSVQIRSIVPADVGGVALCDSETGDYRYIGGWGMEIKSRDILHTADWLGNPVLNYGRPLMRKDLDEEIIFSPFDKLLHGTGVRSDIYAPIMRKGKTVGIFFLGCFRKNAFTNEDMETAVTFASRMGIALEHVRLIYDLDEMSVNIIHALASAIDAKSSWTKGHSERVSDYAMTIAEKMGMNKQEIERLRLAGLLHDIGKIGTYDILLDKAGKLTEEEWELIKLHPGRGCEILAPITEFKDILPAVRHHHERWDGRGYPNGLRGDEIPLMARILCVADSFDTMTADRPYRPAIGLSNATQEIAYCSGTQFAPEVADTFLKLVTERGPEITKLRNPIQKHHSPVIWGTS